MFYPEKIVSIKPGDRVLEVGPGANPHLRSNEFLELTHDSDEDKLEQRGGGRTEGNFGNRPIHYYDGTVFPFDDGEFDYVICSHVVEHVKDPRFFMQEIFRVGKRRGYIEYPLIPYEYLYSFRVHKSFIKFDFEARTLLYMEKTAFQFQAFTPIHVLFYNMLVGGWDDLCVSNKSLFFEGFEFNHAFEVQMATNISQLCPTSAAMVPKSTLRRLLLRVMNKLKL